MHAARVYRPAGFVGQLEWEWRPYTRDFPAKSEGFS